jgi:dUTPase
MTGRAEQYYGSKSPRTNKFGDVGIDLPLVSATPTRKLSPFSNLYSLETVFAFYQIDFHLPLYKWYEVDQDAWLQYVLDKANVSDNYFYKLEAEDYNNYRKDYGDLETLLMVLLTNGLSGVNKSSASGFNIFPRSSISKSPYRLSNSVGVIDRTYKFVGTDDKTSDCIGIALDDLENVDHTFNRRIMVGDRYAQIAAPDMQPIIHIKLDCTLGHKAIWQHYIAPTTVARCGFGSTGE